MSEPHPVSCPRCGGVIGYETELGVLSLVGMGIHVTYLQGVHACGHPFYWSKPTRMLERLIERQLAMR